jgi:hypothetical protein
MALVIGLLIFQVPSVRSQRIEFDTRAQSEDKGGGYWAGWEPVQGRLVFRRDVADPSLPAVKVLDVSGKTLALYPLRDFPGASYIDIWDAKGAPSGDVIISAILGYGPRKKGPVPLKSLLLTYDSTGTLRKVWEVDPYHHHLVAVDSQGNVFAFGDARDSSHDYPLLIKYSSQGDVVKKFLPANLFSSKDSVVRGGEPRMFIKGDKLFLYVAATQELFTFSLDGVLLSRTWLGAAYQRIVELNGGGSIRAFEFSADLYGNIVAEVRIYPKDNGQPQTLALAKFAPDGSLKGLQARPAGSSRGEFLGLTTADQPVYLQQSERGSLFVDLDKHYELP